MKLHSAEQGGGGAIETGVDDIIAKFTSSERTRFEEIVAQRLEEVRQQKEETERRRMLHDAFANDQPGVSTKLSAPRDAELSREELQLIRAAAARQVAKEAFQEPRPGEKLAA